jgi:hypothetical protein
MLPMLDEFKDYSFAHAILHSLKPSNLPKPQLGVHFNISKVTQLEIPKGRVYFYSEPQQVFETVRKARINPLSKEEMSHFDQIHVYDANLLRQNIIFN